MLATIIVPLLFMIVGGAFFVLATNPKVSEMGKIIFAAGAFALAFFLAGQKFVL